MAGYARYTAVLDACVLFPVAICDSLLSVAATNLYAPKWTTRIDEEWMRNLAHKTGRPITSFNNRCTAMHEAFPDWEVEERAWRPIADGLTLPDTDDVHVLAAAIAGHADCIVTTNLRDFPHEALAPFGIEAIHPDDFLVAQLDLDQLAVLTAFKNQRMRLRKPEMTPEVFVDGLERNGLVALAQRLRDALTLI